MNQIMNERANKCTNDSTIELIHWQMNLQLNEWANKRTN